MTTNKRCLLFLVSLAIFLAATCGGVRPVYAGDDIIHVVRRGEYLASIAARYGVSASSLASYNGLRNANQLWPGQVLRIPAAGRSAATLPRNRAAAPRVAPTTADASAPIATPETRPTCSSYYIVRSGDSLAGIAALCGTSVSALMQANGLRTSYLYVGQRLYLYAAAAPASSAALPTSMAAPAVALRQASIYIVRPGDTLAGIAARYGLSTPQLMSANGITSNYLYVGQRLVIPPIS